MVLITPSSCSDTRLDLLQLADLFRQPVKVLCTAEGSLPFWERSLGVLLLARPSHALDTKQWLNRH